jgi:hypothetical protein
LIDVHVHLSPSAAIGAWSKADYEIWEYGRKPDVRFGTASGDLASLRAAMVAGGVEHAVVVNAFSADEWQRRWRDGVEEPPPDGSLGTALVRLNEWLLDAVSGEADITPFVAVDPVVLGFGELVAHLCAMRERGARGVKIHPIEQGFAANDPRMLQIYRLCSELDLIVIAHSGTTRGPVQLAEPTAFIDVLDAVPHLRLVVAHLGGGSWMQAVELARRHPRVAFDLSEIVAWTGAPDAPTDHQLVRLLRDVGIGRVMFGSDFPWYDPGVMADQVRALPDLTSQEADAVLAGNAASVLAVGATA